MALAPRACSVEQRFLHTVTLNEDCRPGFGCTQSDAASAEGYALSGRALYLKGDFEQVILA
eukprot:7465925-Pyramimonas_sp.AAC.1